MEQPLIILKQVQVHNLKKVDLTLRHNELIVFTGVSGSGKSSLAFDTIYVEGQRRYIESLSAYARRQMGDFPKPDAELISGLSPTIAIEQKTAGQNPRSTVGTMTSIYDFLRVLFARVATAHCPVSGDVVTPQSAQQILHAIFQYPKESRILILSPFAHNKKGSFKEEFQELMRKGFTKVRLDKKLIDLSDEIAIDGKIAHDLDLLIDRVTVHPENQTRLAEAVSQALEKGKGLLTICNADTGDEQFFSEHAYSAKSGLSYRSFEPSDFSFNHPSGMCPACHGLGITQEFDLEKVIDPKKSIAEDCCSVASPYETVRYGNIYRNLASLYDFKITTPWEKIPKDGKQAFLFGIDKKWTKMRFTHPETKKSWVDYVHWKGVLREAKERFDLAKSDLYKAKYRQLMQEQVCTACHGSRLQPYPSCATLGGMKIHEICALPLQETLAFFKKLSLPKQAALIAEELVKEIVERLEFLQGVGLHYLSLDRIAPTLSGGESQRVRLASQIGSGLVGATYVLDEPSIGLHPRDNGKLIETLQKLKNLGNTVIVVEHDEETIRAADTIIDVGPLAGSKGGAIVVKGTLQDLLKSKDSETGAYLAGRKEIPIPNRRSPKNWLTLSKASHHNLKKVDLKLPLSVFVAITGVSGSGKSSLVTDTLYPALANLLQNANLPVGKHEGISGVEAVDKVIAIDQTPIGRTPRSNPATFIKLFDDIRDLFAQLPDSQAQGYTASRFSFNVKEGSCCHCSGMGMIRIDMDFLTDEWVPCEHCKGMRFEAGTLSILYKGKHIHDVLEMTIEEAASFFSAIPSITTKLRTLLDVGLEYMKLGQPSPTLSGGEAQRIKLARELCRPSTGKTLYILDEPTTGLHFHDINNLIRVLQKLVDKGNTVLVIEHNMDLVKVADFVIDLGPEGGQGGGKILAAGTPEKLCKLDTPTTKALLPYLKKKSNANQNPHLFLPAQPLTHISVEKASQNNLKEVSAAIPRGKITVCTGPSGSGKSSFAFETIYAEGQRRYIESMSPYARQFVKQCPKPKVEKIEGLSPAIAIEQKVHAGNPRSTIGTLTEIYDFLRILYAHLGIAHCPETGKPLQAVSKNYIANQILALEEGTKVHLLSLISLKNREGFAEEKEKWQKLGFLRIRLNGTYYELDEEIPYDPQRKNEIFLVIDRFPVQASQKKRVLAAVDQATNLSQGTCVAAYEEKDLFFNLSLTSVGTGKSYPPITPHSFSFNTESGMCPECEGLGFHYGIDLSSYEEILSLTPSQLTTLLWKEHKNKAALRLFTEVLKQRGMSLYAPLSDLSQEDLSFLFNGIGAEPISVDSITLVWKGLNNTLADLSTSKHTATKQALLPLFSQTECPTCQGSRLNPLARNVELQGIKMAELCHLSIDEVITFFDNLSLSEEHLFLQEPLETLRHKLLFLTKIGVGYLSLDRTAPTLSGGETQRIRLARQLGSGLTGCLYVLDEPTVGLHPQDNAKLNDALKTLATLGNTLLLVEHDPMTIKLADYIVDFGPKAGKEGGQICARGSYESILSNPDSLTGSYLSGRKKIPIPKKRRASTHFLTLSNATLHNLKTIDLTIPLQAITCITGVSGSGKSTLLLDLLEPAAKLSLKGGKRKKWGLPSCTYKGSELNGMDQINQLLTLSQNPLGHTQRADVASYVDLLTPLRYHFAALAEARVRGLEPKHFSSNHRRGMCTTCQGLGYKQISLQFLPTLRVLCESCQGFRLNPLSLEVKMHGKHLGHILQMSVTEALSFLPPIPKVVRILETLVKVGLDYLQLGQEIATLSGGEAQRLRLSFELAKTSLGSTLYLLDEPTVGLHPSDIAKLIPIFHALVEKGNTVVIIEHNLDLILQADHLIDIGPGAGVLGGEVVATGTPEEVAKSKRSLTAPFLTQEKYEESIC